MNAQDPLSVTAEVNFSLVEPAKEGCFTHLDRIILFSNEVREAYNNKML